MRMKTPGAVLLLLWAGVVVVAAESGGLQHEATGAAAASTQQTSQPDIHTVLREMTALITEQKMELRHTKTQMEAMEKKAETMETRLRASEKTVEEQGVELRYTKTQVDAVEARLRASENKAETMEARLRASENKAEIMEARQRTSENKAEIMEARLRASESLVEQLKSENAAHAMNLSLTVSEVADLKREREQRRVSFSASLLASGSGNTGPFSAAVPLVYRHVFTNVGDGYNPNTGVFTAPVRGVYHFVVFLHGRGSSTATGLSLHKNGEHVAIAFSYQSSGRVNPSNGASLLLEVGDVVYVKLWPHAWVHDNYLHRHTTFSGHLLFPM